MTCRVDIGPLAVQAIDDVDHLTTTVALVPPSGQVTDFKLTYDVIVDYLQSHEVVVASGLAGSERTVIGTIDYVTDHILVERSGSSGSFSSMMTLGFDHVLDGADHLLFLVVLLLPASLLAATGRRWGSAGRLVPSMVRVLQVATAFTLGHSVTLAASALSSISVLSRPVEIVVALSIAVAAVHAIRPIVRNGEALIAGGFGLVHGLAFAGILDDYGLVLGTAATSLLGFNLGVELAQLVTIALVFPSLYVLSKGRFYNGFRIAAPGIAVAVSLGWATGSAWHPIRSARLRTGRSHTRSQSSEVSPPWPYWP